MSQAELASELGVTRAYLSQVEGGKKQASLDFLRKVADRFRVPLSLLLAWDGEQGIDSEIQAKLQRLFAELLSARIAISHGGMRPTTTLE
jgi:transcriptional regulator with XRE-family HTH domain